MQEKTIILQFNKIAKQLTDISNRLREYDKHIQQLYMVNNATSLAFDGIVKSLIIRELITEEEIKNTINNIVKKRNEKKTEHLDNEVATQPDFGGNSNLNMMEEE